MPISEKCIALGCELPTRAEDLLLCENHAVEWRRLEVD